MASRLHSGVVQPQDACTLSSLSGESPVFTMLKIKVAGRPWGIFPKLWLFSFISNTSAGPGMAVPLGFGIWLAAVLGGGRAALLATCALVDRTVINRTVRIANFFIVWLTYLS